MRFFFLIIFILSVVNSNAQVLSSLKDVVKPTQKSQIKSLNGLWDFLFINGADWEEYNGFYNVDYKLDGWDKIPVPGCWDALGYVAPKYVNPDELNGLYRTYFEIPRKWNKQHVFLCLDGVLRGYEVWVNGHSVGKWESSYNTCYFDITSFLKKGRNLLALRVYTRYKGFDFDGNDDWGQVGINRSVSLFAVPEVHIKDFTVVTDQVSEENARVRLTFDIASFSTLLNKNVSIEGRIKDPVGKVVAAFDESVSGEDKILSKDILLKQPFLWNAETPYLYTLEYSLLASDSKQHFTTRFGIREVSIEKNVIKLNGHKLKLRGINLHETDPFQGKVVSEELDLKDLSMMKAANINCVRCSHYPRSPRFYDLCDSIGLYVINEVPFGFGDSHLYDTSYQDILLTRADATVRRDKNHPSVLFWSIGNENPLTPIAEETGRYVKRMDPTRPICYPMIHNYFLSLDFNLPEFIDVFAPHYPTVATLRYYAEASKRPVILTEYCHSLGQSFEQHKELWELIQANDNLAGGCVWEWVDQGMVNSDIEFPGKYAQTHDLWLKDSTCIVMEGNSGADGMLYANRIPLSNYYELRRNYAQALITTTSVAGKKGKNLFELGVTNRFDFTDLKDKVYFKWQLIDGKQQINQGIAKVQCPAGESTKLPISVILPEEPLEKFYHINMEVYTYDNYKIGDYSILITTSEGLFMNNLFALASIESSSMDTVKIKRFCADNFQIYPLMRAGRKFSMSEELRATKAVYPYLLEPQFGNEMVNDSTWTQTTDYINKVFKANGNISYRALSNGGIEVDYKITPLTKNKQLLESGIAFLLHPQIQYVQWLGFGPYASYPGKQSANSYGIHALQTGDLYFEGNRMGVDALVCTDSNGNGFLILSSDSNVNFEQTDSGIVLSVNSVVSGLCGKLRETAYSVYTDDVETISGSLRIFPLKEGIWPESLSYLFFDNPGASVKSWNPYITNYDTYLQKYEDVVQ